MNIGTKFAPYIAHFFIAKYMNEHDMDMVDDCKQLQILQYFNTVIKKLFNESN